MQVVVQKIASQTSFSSEHYVYNRNQRVPDSASKAFRHKESGHEKVRSMPWKAGVRCPLP